MSIGKANVSEDKWSDEYVGLIHEQGVEVFDHDLNLLQDFNRKNFEFLMQTFLGDGYIYDELLSFKIVEASSHSQNFGITEGSYFLKGKRFKLSADVDYTAQTYGYPVITVTGVSGTTITVEHKKFVPSASTGRDLVGFNVEILTGLGVGTYAITSNTIDTITTATNFTTAGVIAGDTFKITPPSLNSSTSGSRTDIVYLDCFEEEVNDYEDTTMKDTAFDFSSSHRLRNGSCVRVAEGGTIPSDYESGTNIHRYIQIGTLTRSESDADIVTADITDNRSMCELAQNVALPSALWQNITDTTHTMEFNKKYRANNSSQVVFTIPAITDYDIGKELEVSGEGAGGWKIVQSSGQSIYFGNKTVTTTTGYLESTHIRDAIRLRVLSTTELQVLSCQGNITYT